MDFLKDPKKTSLEWAKNPKEIFWDVRPEPLLAILRTILLIFFFSLKANIWRGLRCHMIFSVSMHSLPWGLPIVTEKFVWHLRPLEIFELENSFPGSFMGFPAWFLANYKYEERHWVLFWKPLPQAIQKV